MVASAEETIRRLTRPTVAEVEASKREYGNAVTGCATCAQILSEHGFGPTHNGSSRCESGAIAAGGDRSHCSCDVCW